MSAAYVSLSLRFDSGNQSVVDDPEGEAVRILKETADEIDSGVDIGTIRDVNGNSIGSWSLDIEYEDDDDD